MEHIEAFLIHIVRRLLASRNSVSPVLPSYKKKITKLSSIMKNIIVLPQLRPVSLRTWVSLKHSLRKIKQFIITQHGVM